MLKIKEGVNLKELEKFGFVLCGKGDCQQYRGYSGELEICVGMDGRFYRVEMADGSSFGWVFNNDVFDNLAKIIQAGLVEVVE